MIEHLFEFVDVNIYFFSTILVKLEKFISDKAKVVYNLEQREYHSDGILCLLCDWSTWHFPSEGSTKVASEATDIGRSAFFPASGLSNTFGFKIQDKQGRMHRFNCGMHPHLNPWGWSCFIIFLPQ